MKYSITLKNNLRVLRGVLIYHIVIIAFYAYAIWELDDGHGAFTMVFEIGYAMAMFPTLFLHIEYCIRNWNDEIIIDSEQNLISFNGQESFSFNLVDKITIFMAPVWHRNTTVRYWPFENYRYAKLQMKDGRQYIFTCLMAFDLDKALAQIKGVPIENKVRIIATPLID